MAYENSRDESIPRTLGRVVDDVRELFREEMALARAELRQDVSAWGSAAAQMGIGAAAGGFALLFLLLGLAQGFAMLVGWPAWGGYVAMAAVLGLVALAALQMARKRARTAPGVPQTVESIKETKEWMKDRMTSAKR